MSLRKCKLNNSEFHDAIISMINIKNINNSSCCQAHGIVEPLRCYQWKCKVAQILWKTLWNILTKLTIVLSCISAIVQLGISQKIWKFTSRKNLLDNVYVSYIYIPKLEAIKMSSIRWVNKLWYIHPMKYYSEIKEKSYQATQRYG
jgi:hypothetical protein